MVNTTESRKKAWETRRSKYGPKGHSGYSSVSRKPNFGAMLGMILQLHIEGVLSEGQVSKCTGMSRLEIRRMVDGMRDGL